MSCQFDRMAENSRMSKLSEKDDEYVFSWKLFTAWDYMIGNAETAHNRVASIIMGFKEALLEEAEKKRDKRNWKVICFRVLVNTVVIGLLSFSVFAVVMVVKRSTEPEANSTFWRKNEITIIMSLITLVFPMLFEVLGFVEQYHPRKQLRLQLARIMVLNLLNLYSLIFALIDKISDMAEELEEFKNITMEMKAARAANKLSSIQTSTLHTTTAIISTSTSTTPSYSPVTECYLVCNDSDTQFMHGDNLVYDLANNISHGVLSTFLDLVTEINVQNVTDYLNSTVNSISTSFDNATEEYFPSDVFFSLKEFFLDYLTNILDQFNIENNTITTNVYENNTTNFTDYSFNATDSLLNATDYELFKTTMLPVLLNFTNLTDISDDRFDIDATLSTIFENVTNAVSNVSDLTTLSPRCKEICNAVSAENDTTFFGSYNDGTDLNLTYEVTTTTAIVETSLNYSMRARLRSLCWETMFGQELIKLTVMDLIMTIFPTLAIDFFRGLFVRFMNRCWCWDLEKKFPQYGDFKVAENILSLVNNQGMVWMGMFFSPGLVLLNVIKLYIMMYFRTWAVLTCNAPPEVIFRASRSNNFYYALLLMMLFLCVLPVGYAIVWIKPSWHCGPFSQYERIFHIFTKTIRNTVPVSLQKVLDYIASPGIVIPLLVLLILIIYYLVSLTNALRNANEELKIQLRKERTEERRKMFQIADRRRKGGSGESTDLPNAPFNKWKKLLNNLPNARSFDETPKQDTDEVTPPKEEKPESRNKDFFSKLIKRALGKSSTSDEDQNVEDETDTEQHDSLPYDSGTKPHKALKQSNSSSSDFQALTQRMLDIKRNSSVVKKNDNDDEVGEKEVGPKKRDRVEATSSRKRQDSETSSIWSENIPVIKISKTDSTEKIINDESKKQKSEGKFKPKVKCALKKQHAEVDEDTICFFGNDLERKAIEEETIKEIVSESIEEDDSIDQVDVREEITDKSSSDRDDSCDTVLSVSCRKEN
ncbi:unnamed protein product [Acanthoscelides obtectus]|uniref:TMC domain-containing protein n=2 Tax=Acanthoscelides obtectus TaxID=200917 RepID=A0A9P0PUI2_ACAOB|nr:unnamed protein product [Acanthoscelides obtectus]CAK1675913.1 Transmembrane channel-like protein 3 [Acanthoscelides obtectus]